MPAARGFGVNVAQRPQRMAEISVGHRGGMVSPFPEMPATAQLPVEQHGGVPVQPMHQPRHILGLRRPDHVVDVVLSPR